MKPYFYPGDMKVKIKYFGMIEEVTRISEETREVGSISAEELRSLLEKEYEGLETLTYRIAVNGQLDQEENMIPEGAELALLPPFAGG